MRITQVDEAGSKSWPILASILAVLLLELSTARQKEFLPSYSCYATLLLSCCITERKLIPEVATVTRDSALPSPRRNRQ